MDTVRLRTWSRSKVQLVWIYESLCESVCECAFESVWVCECEMAHGSIKGLWVSRWLCTCARKCQLMSVCERWWACVRMWVWAWECGWACGNEWLCGSMSVHVHVCVEREQWLPRRRLPGVATDGESQMCREKGEGGNSRSRSLLLSLAKMPFFSQVQTSARSPLNPRIRLVHTHCWMFMSRSLRARTHPHIHSCGEMCVYIQMTETDKRGGGERFRTPS